MSDLIDRQAAIDAIGNLSDEMYRTVEKGATVPTKAWFDGMAQAEHIVKNLPSAPRLHITEYIPVAWIENEIEWLRGLENCFSDLTAMNIESMLKRWREQQESEADKDGRVR